jgi:hypothetical protein
MSGVVVGLEDVLSRVGLSVDAVDGGVVADCSKLLGTVALSLSCPNRTGHAAQFAVLHPPIFGSSYRSGLMRHTPTM